MTIEEEIYSVLENMSKAIKIEKVYGDNLVMFIDYNKYVYEIKSIFDKYNK